MSEDTKPDLCPETDLLMQIAWRDCLLWSISSTEPDFVGCFETATGLQLPRPANSPIERMIDDATGYSTANVPEYIVWFNEHVWGTTFGPATKEILGR